MKYCHISMSPYKTDVIIAWDCKLKELAKILKSNFEGIDPKMRKHMKKNGEKLEHSTGLCFRDTHRSCSIIWMREIGWGVLIHEVIHSVYHMMRKRDQSIKKNEECMAYHVEYVCTEFLRRFEI